MTELSEEEDKRNMKIVMIGLDKAGKTTLLYRLKLEKLVQTMPTLGFNVESVEYKNISFTLWDVGGIKNTRPLWRHYMGDETRAIIFVVDSSNLERIDEARTELMKVLSMDEIKDLPLLIYANKQDLSKSVNTAEIMNKLGLHTLENCNWYIQASSAISGDGLHKGLDWLYNKLENQK